MTPLSGRTAVVTGASRGIGAAIAAQLASDGAAVALLARDWSRLSAVVEAIRSTGGTAHPVRCDVTDRQSVSEAVVSIRSTLGDPAILVNNAGFGGPFHLATEVPDEEWELLFATNIRSAFWFCRALLPGMTAMRFGRIINISSVLGLSGAARSSTYSATKHALVGYTKSLAVEWGAAGVTCNAVCPGYINTDMTASRPEAAGVSSRSIPSGRLGTPDEIARVVSVLARADSSYINGAVVTVDGGLTAACREV